MSSPTRILSLVLGHWELKTFCYILVLVFTCLEPSGLKIGVDRVKTRKMDSYPLESNRNSPGLLLIGSQRGKSLFFHQPRNETLINLFQGNYD